ncbi:MAG TPA: hypothetical protein ENH55_16735 [Aurantimonas coralicida]|uniref:Uncharacterized protein n=2 Tax=root TaxID=1 RepID=A0A9C9NIK7_9HYPH|nr:hypothetical protein [Aurantimonas coralicida]HEU02129.1 hypothetical protein [Aurantimonas coralicida]
MVGLIDIAPAVETVPVGDKDVAVYGVSVHGIADLLRRFPELSKLFTGKLDKPEHLIDLGPDIVVAIIAAGTGAPGDNAAEDVARRLGVEVQIAFLDAILRLTMPGGLGPFAERLARLGVLFGVEDDKPGAAPSGKKRASRSRKRLKR